MTDDPNQVIDTVMRMAQLTDAREWEGLAGLFSDQVDLDYTSLNGGEPVTIPGSDVVAGWQENLERLDATQHLLGTPVATVGETEATLTCAVTGTHRRENGSGGSLWTVGGHYDVRLDRDGDGWRISGLRLRVAWATGNQAIMAP